MGRFFFVSLLQAIKADPNISLFVKYEGSSGIDEDGLSRQALQLAYTQLLNNENGVAEKQESEGFQLKTLDDSQLKNSSSLDEFHDFGLLASHIAKVPMGAGYDLDPNSFEQMHTCFNQLFQTGNYELLLSESSEIFDFIDGMCATPEGRKTLASTLGKVNDSYQSQAAQDYLIDSGKGDNDILPEYAKKSLSGPLAMAIGFSKVNLNTHLLENSDSTALKEAICGSQDLKGTMLKRLIIKDATGTTFSEAQTVELASRSPSLDAGNSDLADPNLKLAVWANRYIGNASYEELQSFCKMVTGASHLPSNGHIKIELYDNGPSNSNDIRSANIVAHTCFRSIDIPQSLLSQGYEVFSAALNATGSSAANTQFDIG